jgi:acetyl esterase/lipase
MKKVALPIFILILFFFNACSTDDGENSDLKTAEATELKNISYGADAQQTYDIYLPKNRSLNTRVMLLIHGGGWTSGDKMICSDFTNSLRPKFLR